MVVDESAWNTKPVMSDPVVEKAAEFLEAVEAKQREAEIQERRNEKLEALQLTNVVNKGAEALKTRIKKRNVSRKQKEKKKKAMERAENFFEHLEVKKVKSGEKAALREKWKALY